MFKILVPLLVVLISFKCRSEVSVRKVFIASSSHLKNTTQIPDSSLQDDHIHRIVGDRIISITEAPWQIALFRNRVFICGGSCISKKWVLTAAHCVYGAEGSRFMVRGGSDFFKRGGQVRAVIRVVINGGYNPRTSNVNIAMLKLRKPFSFSQYSRAIKIGSPFLPVPSHYFVSGWGLQRESASNPTVRLKGVDLSAVRRDKCPSKYAAIGATITDNMFCAAGYGKDTCSGDSGGAIVYKRIQYGIVSFGLGCARENFPGVYTNLRPLWLWVYKVAWKN